MSKFKIIYADPPWTYQDKGCNGNAADHYNTMTVQDICNMPINRLVDKDAILFMWCTYPMLQEGIKVMSAWGFKYKTIGFQWIKLNPKAKTLFFGLGRWTRGNTEACFIATKGKPHRADNSVSQIVVAPRGRHSEKPPIVRDRIVQLCGDIPRLELFARQHTPGWYAWGNEVEPRNKVEKIVHKILTK